MFSSLKVKFVTFLNILIDSPTDKYNTTNEPKSYKYKVK